MKIAYTISGFWRGVVIATVLAGTLEILAALLLDILAGGTPLDLLTGIAAAAWPALDIGEIGTGSAGLVIHFFITVAMVVTYFAAAAIIRPLNRHTLWSGIGYGLLLWIVMHWVVLPRRFPTMFPVLDPREVGIQLFCHVILVGIPIAWVAHIAARWRTRQA
ncbi:hypothetical protein QH494_20430 [Sphingomonas sp. AR_OL41]|uniref:hypothetical protein n=1 Tax=Sphingomonas sp. AR_OL41 TaxID=3042729 RepID=UPI00248118C2|nr:hypothetical protein [Sphingomonas sp. AR_OL41]MDH7974564.1 hypothetical protein [Sphingomonas sp. AR_OL41]